MLKLILSTFFSIVTIVALAQEGKIETDRPDQTESPYTVPKKWVQFEIGFNAQRNSKNNNEYFHPTLLSKYGVSKKFELRLITTLQTNTTLIIPNGTIAQTGLNPVEIGGKIALCEEKNLLPKTSLIFHTAFPKLASKTYKADKLAPNFRFTMQNSLTKNIALGYNLGAEWDGFTNNATWIYTFAPGFNLGEKWYAYIEAFGFITKGETPQHSLDAGIAYYVTDNLKLDLSGGPGITKNAPQRYIAFGASFRFKAFK